MPGRASPTATSKGARTRQRILAAAASEFAQRGYDGTTLRNVAERADLHLGSLYFHFGSKEELVGAAISDAITSAHQQVKAALDALPGDAGAGSRFRTAIHSHLEALHADQDRGSAVVRMAVTLPPDLRASFAGQEHRYGSLWLKVIEHAQDEGVLDQALDARQVRDLLIGALNSTLTTVRPSKGAPAKAATTAFALWTVGAAPRS